MKTYEIVTELFNPCAGDNRPFNTEIVEKDVEDPVKYVTDLNGGEKCPPLSVCGEEDGTLIIELDVSGNKRRYTFSLI